MGRVYVRLKTVSDGEGETLYGKGVYDYHRENSIISFSSENVSYKIILNESLIVVRKGEISYELRFCAGETRDCEIATPYGSIPARLKTNDLQVSLTPLRAEIRVEYTLITGEVSATHSMNIAVLPITENK